MLLNPGNPKKEGNTLDLTSLPLYLPISRQKTEGGIYRDQLLLNQAGLPDSEGQ